ncbi:LEG4 protein, partial [Atractosteus spatula]|nr:LEG4 protein [Atractosteus spatula]
MLCDVVCVQTVPYLGPINGNLRAGMSIYIQGRVPHEITRLLLDTLRFHVNLQCGDFEGCDIAFHFNPRFDGWDKVVFNTFQNGSWEGEEKVREMPFRKGEHFELIIVVNMEGYQVNVNGRQFYLFQHRMPLERVSNLEIGGDVIIQSLNILGLLLLPLLPVSVTTTAVKTLVTVTAAAVTTTGGAQGGMQGYPGGIGGGMQGGMQGYPGGMQDYPSGGMGGMGLQPLAEPPRSCPLPFPLGQCVMPFSSLPQGGVQGYPSGGMGGMGGGGMGYPGANLPMISGAPVYNPPIPYSNMIPGGMNPKRTIIIRGMVPYGANRFHVNFMVGFSRDIAFHLNPRVAEGLVVRNSCLGGSWGQEERDLEFNPFQEGQYFEISVRCGNQRYKVFVNGQYLCDFFHRLQPFTQVDTLEMISGAPVYNPPIPYSNMIPGGMNPKRTIIIRGMVPYGANRFHVNFMVGFSRDIAFHLNPRVAEGLVVRNSCLGGSWGQEERDLEFNPFQEGQYFEISVRCGNQRYKVFVNGQYLCDFFHRLQPFTQVDTLEVEGDVQLSYIHF